MGHESSLIAPQHWLSPHLRGHFLLFDGRPAAAHSPNAGERSGNLWIVAVFHAIGNAYIVSGVDPMH